MKIDAHQHFWQYNPIRDAWITEDMKTIQHDFLPSDLGPILARNQIDGCIAVQADQSTEETNYLLHLTEHHKFIKGVVGWINFKADDIEEQLHYYSKFEKLKGFRHVVQAEIDDNFLLDANFCRGISYLERFNLTYDLLILPKHLKVAVDFVAKFPNQKFVIDHMAKPHFKTKEYKSWEEGMEQLAKNPNVYCKISGLATEADWKKWKISDFEYCIQFVITHFGVDRIMFGSDWPVCLLTGSYEEALHIIESSCAMLSIADQEKLWGQNAIKFYNL